MTQKFLTNTFLTIEEVAETLKVTRQTVSKYIHEKDLNAVKINKSYRISDNEFENFLNKNSSFNGTEIAYSKKTKGCSLNYEGKESEYEILNFSFAGEIKTLEVNHGSQFNKFIFGDNFHVLKYILKEIAGRVDLIYIDPPFGTGQDFSDNDNNLAYNDKLINNEYLDFLRKRLILLRECLSKNGSIYVHIDKKIGHYVKIIMDEVFGYENFVNDITRIKCNPKNFSRNAYGNYSDMILFYSKERDNNIWNDIREPLMENEVAELFPKMDKLQERYTTNPLHAPGKTVNGDTGMKWKNMLPPKGRHWRYSREELTRLEELGLIEWSDSGNPRKIVYAKNHKGKKLQDVWEFKDKGISYVSYPTEKNINLIKRIIENSSNKNSLVLDCFAGSGSTLVIADQLNRKWIGIDNSHNASNVIKNNFNKYKVECNYFIYEE